MQGPRCPRMCSPRPMGQPRCLARPACATRGPHPLTACLPIPDFSGKDPNRLACPCAPMYTCVVSSLKGCCLQKKHLHTGAEACCMERRGVLYELLRAPWRVLRPHASTNSASLHGGRGLPGSFKQQRPCARGRPEAWGCVAAESLGAAVGLLLQGCWKGPPGCARSPHQGNAQAGWLGTPHEPPGTQDPAAAQALAGAIGGASAQAQPRTHTALARLDCSTEVGCQAARAATIERGCQLG